MEYRLLFCIFLMMLMHFGAAAADNAVDNTERTALEKMGKNTESRTSAESGSPFVDRENDLLTSTANAGKEGDRRSKNSDQQLEQSARVSHEDDTMKSTAMGPFNVEYQQKKRATGRNHEPEPVARNTQN